MVGSRTGSVLLDTDVRIVLGSKTLGIRLVADMPIPPEEPSDGDI